MNHSKFPRVYFKSTNIRLHSIYLIRKLIKNSAAILFPQMTSLSVHIFIIFFFLVRVSSMAAEAATVGHSNVSLGSTLSPNASPSLWLSPSGRFAFGFYPQGTGFSVGVFFEMSLGNTTVIWTANRDQQQLSKAAVLKLTEAGLSLLLPAAEGEDRPIFQASTAGSGLPFAASMLDSGNFIIFDSGYNLIWQTFDSPTDTIMTGQVLTEGSELISSLSETNHSSGRFRLKMQDDGNLVSYPVNTKDTAENAYWSSNDTFRKPFHSLHLDDDGRLYLLGYGMTSNLTQGYSSRRRLLHRARLEPDGVFRLYAHDLKANSTQVIAAFPSDSKCTVKGFCGWNSYCTSAGEQQVCLCLPGFDYVDVRNKFAGCERNFTSRGCLNTTEVVVKALENVVWLADQTAQMQPDKSKEECISTCLSDCNCDAVQFKDRSCLKQTFPLRYGRRDRTNSTITFVKVGRNIEGNPVPVPARAAVTRIEKQSFPHLVIVFLAVASCFLFLLVVLSVAWMYFGRRVLRPKDETAMVSFSYRELREATGNFEQELGKGAFGTVFKGSLSGRAVAVKRLEKVVEEGEREFKTEMRAIGRTHHRNLVRLLGFCKEGSKRLLVYEYVSNGSLARLIFRSGQERPPWPERVRIALDVAKGINYLHEECETRIIHCDIKPENILMDENWTAKISDFGLAKLLTPSQTRTFTEIRGTRGYLAPEWHTNAAITVKADVYSFGVVLLEIICCRKNMELGAEVDEIILMEWVQSCFMAGEVQKLVADGEDVDMAEFGRMLKVGMWCIQEDPSLRPTMKKVILMMEGGSDVSIPPLFISFS